MALNGKFRFNFVSWGGRYSHLDRRGFGGYRDRDRLAEVWVCKGESCMAERRGFTLIELLVVIAIIALLMAVLMPTLQRVKRQAKAIGCQSNLKQWGLIFLMYANDHTGRIPRWVESGEPWPQVLTALWPYHQDTNDLFICPMAKPKTEFLGSDNWQLGSTFAAWSLRSWTSLTRIDCSYGLNVWAQYMPESQSGGPPDTRYWQTIPARGAANVPLGLDSVLWWSCRSNVGDPPVLEDTWADSSLPCCMNRHEGFVNGILMDWSIRKIGIKGLWTLQWYPGYSTQGRWTKAGGVQPNDWPEWMRRFRDW
jgi:prepilin-type N-terminal cleavage/methylation domain-containing protein